MLLTNSGYLYTSTVVFNRFNSQTNSICSRFVRLLIAAVNNMSSSRLNRSRDRYYVCLKTGKNKKYLK